MSTIAVLLFISFPADGSQSKLKFVCLQGDPLITRSDHWKVTWPWAKHWNPTTVFVSKFWTLISPQDDNVFGPLVGQQQVITAGILLGLHVLYFMYNIWNDKSSIQMLPFHLMKLCVVCCKLFWSFCPFKDYWINSTSLLLVRPLLV